MNWRLTAESLSYKEAVKSTESTEEPAVVLTKPSEYFKGATTETTTLIKQNNTIIQLLVCVSEKLEDCAENLHQLNLKAKENGNPQEKKILKEFWKI